MERPRFSPARPDIVLLRQIMLQRLRQDPNWEQIEDDNGKGFRTLLEIEPQPPGLDDAFAQSLLDVFWELVNEGVLAPGKNLAGGDMQNLPWFHCTAYGKTVIAAGEYVPHDTTGYLARLSARVQPVDATVRAYLEESLRTFLHGDFVASMVMLGVAAERVFLLVCESLVAALKDAGERDEFAKVLKQQAMRKKLDWVNGKLRRIEDGKRPAGYPDRASLMVVAMYDLMRAQRNDVGHPREDPPRVPREEANAHIQIFPSYYETAETLRAFLKANIV